MKRELLELLQGYSRKIPEDTSINLLKHGIIDSFDIVNIVSLLESHFQIDIDAEDILPENFQSVGAMELMVCKYVNE